MDPMNQSAARFMASDGTRWKDDIYGKSSPIIDCLVTKVENENSSEKQENQLKRWKRGSANVFNCVNAMVLALDSR